MDRLYITQLRYEGVYSHCAGVLVEFTREDSTRFFIQIEQPFRTNRIEGAEELIRTCIDNSNNQKHTFFIIEGIGNDGEVIVDDITYKTEDIWEIYAANRIFGEKTK